eukprot:679716-Karenia_brevis.AAC.1
MSAESLARKLEQFEPSQASRLCLGPKPAQQFVHLLDAGEISVTHIEPGPRTNYTGGIGSTQGPTHSQIH